MPDARDLRAPMLSGADEVLRALTRRRDSGGGPATPGPGSSDGNRIALVVGGGGMRAAYAGGMAQALDESGLAGQFDVVYGSSAGAHIGAALLLGEGPGSARIFYEDMASRAFIDARRLGRRPMVSLDHLIDNIMAGPKPMPWDRLLHLPSPLRVIATDVDDLRPYVLDPTTAAEWKLALRATASIPLLAGSPVRLDGRRWIDGSVSEPLPLLRALADGATHVLTLINRTASELGRAPTGGTASLWVKALNLVRPGLGSIAEEKHRLAPELAVLNNPEHPARQGRHVLAVMPENDVGVHGLTIDPVRVERAATVGYDSVMAALRRAEVAVPDLD